MSDLRPSGNAPGTPTTASSPSEPLTLDEMAARALSWLVEHPRRDWLDAAYVIYHEHTGRPRPGELSDWPDFVAAVKLVTAGMPGGPQL